MKKIYTRKKKRSGLYAILLLLLFAAGTIGIEAQVTIGDGTAAQKFSILEIVSKKNGGLRLPHLTSAQRDILTQTEEFQNQKNRGDAAASKNPGLGLGLTIYNTDTNCVEYWSGYKWVSLCLGTANIELIPSPDECKYPPEINAEGTSPACKYTPKDDPACNVSSGKAYEVYLTTGASYASLEVDELTSAFSVTFQPNNSSQARIAVVRVNNNCSGEFKDFIFTQKGATCPEGINPPTLNTTTLELCNSGSVFSQITNPKEGVNYYWVYSGVAVHTGTWYEIKRPGIYKVYAGLIGCGTPATLTVTDKSASNAPSAVTITATNEGMLCRNGSVILSANTSLPVLWYHEGIPLSGADKNNNPLTLSGYQMAGKWFAVVQDASGCVSNSSNAVTLTDMTNTNTALPVPAAMINGQNISGNSIVICKNGTLKLEVTNASTYPEGTIFEWFNNGLPIGKSEESVIYLVPSNASNMILSVTASNQNGNCPNTAISQPIPVTFTAPSITAINSGAPKVAICDGTPATLTADHAGASAYEWMLNGKTIEGNKQTIQTDKEGDYTVRYKDANSCWSQVSASTKVVNSTYPVLQWKVEPKNAIKGETQTYTINGPNDSEIKYEWTWESSDPNAIISIKPIGNGSSAQIKYGTPQAGSTQATIKVKSIGHLCGTTSIQATVTIADGCKKITSVGITPSGNISLEQGKKLQFIANASTSTNNLLYEWFITPQGGSPVSKQGPSASNNFTYTADATGNYTVSVRATNDCTSAQDNVTTEAKIIVTPDITNHELDTSGNFKLSGNDCFDIAQSNFNNECGEQSIRQGDFLDSNRNWIEGKGWTYTFTSTNSATYSNLQFVTRDPSVLINSESTNSDGKSFTIVFDKSVLTKALGKDRANALTVTIYALYRSGGINKRIEFKINIQDCSCGCGAYIAPNVWKRFMCYNLGADETADPFTPSKQLYGDFYHWGYKEPSVYGPNNPEHPDGIIKWRGRAPRYMWKDEVKTDQDPCPEGYRVPSVIEWWGVIDNNLNPQSTVGTWSDGLGDNNNFTAGRYFGKHLFLPAVGRMNSSNRELYFRGRYGIYLTSSRSPNINTAMGPDSDDVSQVTFSSDKSAAFQLDTLLDGYSVRCIQE